MADRDDIIRRIRALREMADSESATAGERSNARVLIERLQTWYHITDDDLEDDPFADTMFAGMFTRLHWYTDEIRPLIEQAKLAITQALDKLAAINDPFERAHDTCRFFEGCRDIVEGTSYTPRVREARYAAVKGLYDHILATDPFLQPDDELAERDPYWPLYCHRRAVDRTASRLDLRKDFVERCTGINGKAWSAKIARDQAAAQAPTPAVNSGTEGISGV